MEATLIQQLDISFVDISSYIGLVATGVMTINLFFGLLISFQYSPMRNWPNRRIPLSDLHKWTGYSALFLALLHPAILPFTSIAKFTFWDILVPINAPVQPIVYTIGAAAVYSLIFVSITAYLRARFKYAFWKQLHYVSYGVIVLFTIHGVLANPAIKEEVPIDWLDAGKIFVEVCALVCAILLIWRVTNGRAIRRNALQIQTQTASRAWRGFLRVESVVTIGPDVRTVRLVHPNNEVLPFEFKPGQYLSFRFKDGENHLVRNYSISSAPLERNYCEFTVKRIDGGVGSTYFHTGVQPNTLLECTGAHGEFIFSGDEANRVFLIGGGIGVTPLISVLKHLASIQWPHEVYLLFAVRAPDHIIFHQELQAIQLALPRFKYMLLPTDITGTQWTGSSGLINADLVRQLVPEITDCRIHLCGPAPMMDATIALLIGLGVERNQILTELFGSGVKAIDDPLAVDATVVFSKSGVEFLLPAGSTLLEAAEAVSVPLESACRVGSCGTCKVKVLSGSAGMRRDDGLSNREIRDGIVLACQAVPRSSKIVIEY